MYPESDLLPISALQHLLYCERQCALIHIEQAWVENRLTAEGRVLHEKVHGGEAETRPGVRIVRAPRLHSFRIGLFGVADVVEFHKLDDAGRPRNPPVPFPVEYKRGRPKRGDEDRVQLCAQAMCLEEMLGAPVPAGALFYGKPRRRDEVCFDESLRGLTERTAQRLHELLASGQNAARQEVGQVSKLLDEGLVYARSDERTSFGLSLYTKGDIRCGFGGPFFMKHHLNTLFVTTDGAYLGKDGSPSPSESIKRSRHACRCTI